MTCAHCDRRERLADNVLCLTCAIEFGVVAGPRPRRESNLIPDRDDNSDGWSRGRADCE